jgi:hypothetical protein
MLNEAIPEFFQLFHFISFSSGVIRLGSYIMELLVAHAYASFQHITFQSLPPACRQLETASAITLVVVITII